MLQLQRETLVLIWIFLRHKLVFYIFNKEAFTNRIGSFDHLAGLSQHKLSCFRGGFYNDWFCDFFSGKFCDLKGEFCCLSGDNDGRIFRSLQGAHADVCFLRICDQ